MSKRKSLGKGVSTGNVLYPASRTHTGQKSESLRQSATWHSIGKRGNRRAEEEKRSWMLRGSCKTFRGGEKEAEDQGR